MRLLTLILACVISLFVTPLAWPAESVRVGAASSLKEAVTELAASYESSTGTKIEPSFNASGQLAAQIRAGAPVDVFLSAGVKEVDDLSKEKLVDEATRVVFAGNELVLVVPIDMPGAVASFGELANIKKLAIGQPKAVPAGLYATQVLESLKLTDAMQDKLVYGQNVRQVLDYVARGEVDAGIVYRTDAATASKQVRVVATAEASTHKPVQYVAVVVNGAKNSAEANRFVTFLTDARAQAVFEKFGFKSILPTTAP